MIREQQIRDSASRFAACPDGWSKASILRSPQRQGFRGGLERRLGQLEEANAVLRRQLDELRVAANLAQHLACHDELTGLPNRRLLMDRLNQAMARAVRHDKLIILLMVDLNEFKQINDSLGHEAGDGVLQGFAQRVTKVIRGADTVCRYGGDEFVVMLPDIEKVHVWQQFASVASKLHEALAEPFHICSCTLGVSASIGGAIYPDDASCDLELIRKADSAMYAAKRAQSDGLRVRF